MIEGRYEGSIVSFRGDGVLASFGFPVAHENDVDRAVHCGARPARGHRAAGRRADRRWLGDPLSIRVAVHRGLVFLDRDTRDLYGFAVNVAARLEGLAEVGTLLVSDEVGRLIGDRFDLRPHPPREVKGVAGAIATHTVLGPAAGRVAAGRCGLRWWARRRARGPADGVGARGRRRPGDEQLRGRGG